MDILESMLIERSVYFFRFLCVLLLLALLLVCLVLDLERLRGIGTFSLSRSTTFLNVALAFSGSTFTNSFARIVQRIVISEKFMD